MSKIFDNIKTNYEEGLHAIPGSRDRTWLLPVVNMYFVSPKKAFGLTVNCAELKAANGIMHCKNKRGDDDGKEFG